MATVTGVTTRKVGVAVLTGAAGAVSGLARVGSDGWWADRGGMWLAVVTVGALLVAWDVTERRLPNRFVVVFAAATAAAAAASRVPFPAGWVVFGGVLWGVGLFAGWRLGVCGGGDVKLGVVAGAVAGWCAPMGPSVGLAVAGVASGVVWLVCRRAPRPFAVSLLAGLLTVVVASGPV